MVYAKVLVLSHARVFAGYELFFVLPDLDAVEKQRKKKVTQPRFGFTHCTVENRIDVEVELHSYSIEP